jgi:hypothetical protein
MIGISLIIKDDTELRYLTALLTSLGDRLYDVYVTITQQNSKNVKKLIEKMGAHWNYFEWVNDFSKARQYGFDNLPDKYTYIFTCDADDVVENVDNLDKIVKEMEEAGAESCYIPYITSRDKEYGDTIVNVKRVVKRGTGHWVRPIHEIWASDRNTAIASKLVKCIHTKKDAIASEERNLEMLLKIKKKTDEDHRYIAMAYISLNQIDKALEHLLKISPEFGFYFDVLCTIAQIYKWKREYDKGLKKAEELVKVYGEYSNPYFVLGNYLIQIKDYQRALDTFIEGFKHPKMPNIMTASSHNIAINPLGKVAFLYEMLGQHDKAVWCVEALKKIAPDLKKVQELESIIKDVEEEHEQSDVKVSVVVTVYNKAEYLEECIQSVLAQTHSNLELIIVDDCSTDDSIEVIKRFKDDRIKLIENKKNLGCAGSRNVGLKECTGDYIQILDGDDVLDVHKFEKQIGHDVSYSDFMYLYITGKQVVKPVLSEDAFNDFKTRWEKDLTIAIHSFLYKKEVFDKVGYFDETLPNHEDWDFHLRVSKEFRITHIPEVLAYYRVVSDSMTGFDKKEEMDRGYEMVRKRYE